MWEYFQNFCKLLWVKSHPSNYEKSLFEKAQKYSKYISWIPGLKMVAVCNSLSMYSTKISQPSSLRVKWNEMKQSMQQLWKVDHHIINSPRDDESGSDIDLFIVTSPKRLWFVRIAVTIIFQVLWVRRYWNKIKDRFCLSFFITENAMDFSKISIENDVYLFYWIYYLKPIINKDSTYEKFIKANKKLWINEINLHWDNKIYLIKTSAYMKFLDKCKILDFKNWALKKILLKKTLKHKKRLWDPFGLIVNNDMLKFTDNDRRLEIRDSLMK